MVIETKYNVGDYVYGVNKFEITKFKIVEISATHMLTPDLKNSENTSILYYGDIYGNKGFYEENTFESEYMAKQRQIELNK